MDETILELANLCLSECKKTIVKIAHLKQLDKEEIMRNVLPQRYIFQ